MLRTIEQLKSQTWPTREVAAKELKANGLRPSGTDYELRASDTGNWYIADRTADDVPVKQTAAEKPAAKKEHEADAAAREAIAKAKSFTIHFRISPKKVVDRTAETIEAAAAIAAELNAEHGGHGRRAMVYAVMGGKRANVPVCAAIVGEMLKPKETETAEALAKMAATKTPDEPERLANDMSYPTGDGPFSMQLADRVGQSTLMQTALSFSRKIGERIAIIDRHGKVLRIIDGRIGDDKPRKARATNGTGERKAPSRTPAPMDDMAKEIVRMAKRKNGVKRTEMSELNGGVVINWKGYLERFGKREGLTVTVDKTGETPVYRLVAP